MPGGLSEEHIGTFVGLELDAEVARQLEAYCTNAGVPKCVGAAGFHVTTIYSRAALQDFAPAGLLPAPIVATPLRFVTVSTRPRQLLLELDCPEVVERHRATMSAHPSAQYHFDDYTPHITLSYDLGPWNEAHKMEWFQPGFSIPLTTEFSHELIPSGAPRRRSKQATAKSLPRDGEADGEDAAGDAVGKRRPRRASKKKKKR